MMTPPELALAEAIRTVLRGFDAGVFVRDTSHDADSGWAIRLLPYMSALAVLAEGIAAQVTDAELLRTVIQRMTR